LYVYVGQQSTGNFKDPGPQAKYAKINKMETYSVHRFILYIRLVKPAKYLGFLGSLAKSQFCNSVWSLEKGGSVS
jgi:hypothetical protein